MPAKKENPRNYIVSVRVTAMDKEAIRRQKKLQGSTESDVAYGLMIKGSLPNLVASFLDVVCIKIQTTTQIVT